MSKMTKLNWEDAEDFLSYLVMSGYSVDIHLDRKPDNVIYEMYILDINGDVLAQSVVEYNIDISTLVVRCVDDYLTTQDGKTMEDLWRQ